MIARWGKTLKLFTSYIQVSSASSHSAKDNQKLQEMPTLKNLKECGRKPKVSPTLARMVVREEKENPRITTRIMLTNSEQFFYQHKAGTILDTRLVSMDANWGGLHFSKTGERELAKPLQTLTWT